MRIEQHTKTIGRLTISLLVIISAVVSSAATAQEITEEQLKLFKTLSPQQQNQAIEFIKKSKDNSKFSSFKKSQANNIEPKNPVIVEPREVETNDAIEENVKKGSDKISLDEEGKEKKIDKVDLKQFGYDLFSGTPTTFAPATDIPIPSEYVVGPGDNIQVQLFGKENTEYDLTVSREGLLRFPGIGPISVAGLKFSGLKNMLQQRIKSQMIGVKANITMGTLRSIRIFVLGDVVRPGSYTVSALSNMTNALFVSGGIRTIGSLRKIQLKRKGKVVTELDLYDLLLRGDTSSDMRLQPGDVIFVPPIGKTIGIAGEVRRAAIYELKVENTVQDALGLSGGFLPTAYPKVTQIERITEIGEKTLIDIDASDISNLDFRLKDGDVLRVYSILEKMENIVVLSGHVQRPGGVQYRAGMRLLDVVPDIESLLPKPDTDYVIIKREVMPDRHIEVLTTRFNEAIKNPDSPNNVELQSRDEIVFFGLGKERTEKIKSIINHLKQQQRFDQPAKIIHVDGNVHYPGDYPYSSEMRVSDAIRAAYDIKPLSDLNYALVIRHFNQFGNVLVSQVNLGSIFKSPYSEQDKLLEPGDELIIFHIKTGRQKLLENTINLLKQQADQDELAKIVSISGYVVSPGDYPLENNMSIDDLVIAAGGFSESAYTLSAELSRSTVVNGEYREINHYTISNSQLFGGNVAEDLELQPYDHLVIKRIPLWSEQKTIELVGEFKFPGVYPFKRGETLRDVIERAGGLTPQAFVEGSIFTREELRLKEKKQFESLAARLESDLAAISLENTQNPDIKASGNNKSLTIVNSLLKQLRETEPIGRLVIDVKSVLNEQFDDDLNIDESQILLKDGDRLIVPQWTQEVTIIGEVQQSTSHLYTSELNRDDYINLSGGLTHKADDDRIYIVRANGAVVSDYNTGWFGDAQTIKAGDTIVVPLDADRMKPLNLWTSVTQIIYQLGVAAAAWQTVGVF